MCRRFLAVLLVLSGTALPQQTPATAGTIVTPEVELAYETYGAAGTSTPVIVANGGPGLSHVYMLQNDVWTRRLAHNRQIVFYDQRGTGKSKQVKPDASFGMDAQVADMEAVRARLGFAKFDLVGDSYGGLLAMAYAAAHPEHVHKLILSDSAAPALKDIVRVLPDVFPDVLEQIAARDKNTSGANAADQRIRDHFLMLFYSEGNRDRYLAGVKDLGSSPQVSAAVQKASRTLDLTPELSKFKFPTLVITGRYDMNVTPVTAWNIYKAIPGAKFIVFEKSGHLPAYEEPDKYVQVIEGFLGQP
jgi:proline iminopeptidase